MPNQFTAFFVPSLLLAGIGASLPATAPAARAQNNTVTAPVLVQGDDAPGGLPGKPVQAAPARQRTVAEAAAAMTRGLTGTVYVVADSTTGATPAALPIEATTPENVEKQVAALVAKLPPGTIWAKLYLPAPANARRGYNGDDVAGYALAQSKLVGPVGAALPPGTVEIMGQKLPQAKADATIADLNLKPVYLITNPRAQAPSGFGLTMDAGKWAAMSPEQKQEYTRQQAASLSQMDPSARNQMLQQNMMIFAQFMQSATPDQRQSMIQGMMQGMGGQNGAVFIRTAPGGPGGPPMP